MTQSHNTRRGFLRAGAAATAALVVWPHCKPVTRLGGETMRPATADFYVAASGDDAWTGALAQPNADRSDGPFASLARAQQAVRERDPRRASPSAVTVLVRGGVYYLPQGLTFGAEDSGTAEHSVTYAAYPGEHPALIGGVRLTGWRAFRDGVWETDLPDGIRPEQVFENGVRMPLARAPKQGYFTTPGPISGGTASAFEYRAEDLDALDPGAWDIGNAKVTLWPQYNWFNFIRPMAEIDPAKRSIRLRGSFDGYEITAGNRYAILNVLALLTEPGEAMIDLAGHKVYAWPAQAPIEDQAIVVSAATHVILVEGRAPRNPVRNLHFEGFIVSAANDDAVRITGAEDCSVRFCRIENAAETGVRILGHAQRVVVYGNLIRSHGYCGVSLEGLELGMPDVNNGHRIENNHIHDCGRLVGHGAGVYIQQSGHNQVLHNHIHHTPRYGTTIKGLRYQSLREQVPGVTWENHYDYLHSRDNLIAYNDIHHANQDSQDTGAMESWGPGRDNVYDHNLVHDSGNAEFDLQSGMYLDDATDHFTATNNIIWGIVGTTGNQCVFAKGIGNRFENNLFVVGDTNDAAITSMEMGGEECKDHVYRRNLVAVTHTFGALYKFINWGKQRIQESDYNLIWKAKGNVFCIGTPGLGMSKWEDWQELGYDAHSIVADPLLMDVDKRDFRLRPNSPALELGFEPIDVSQIGLRPDFPTYLEKS